MRSVSLLVLLGRRAGNVDVNLSLRVKIETRVYSLPRLIGYIFEETDSRAQELCESRGGRPWLPSLINLRFLWT